MKKVELIATATFGLEAITKRELMALGFEDPKIENGRISFVGEMKDIPRTNLWLRTAERVLLKVGEFKALSFEELFDRTEALPWADYIPYDGNFIVDGKSLKSKLFSISDCQRIVEKAIVKSLQKKYPGTDYFPKTGARYNVMVSMLNDIATITLDTSGEGLHKRGYRARQNQAPIKETMAAAMVMLSYWRKDRLLYDPFCGSGTIPIEAAMIGRNIAPGLDRTFDAEKWGFIPKELWKIERAEAFKAIDNEVKLQIMGSDVNHKMVLMARDNAENMGLTEDVTFFVKDMREVELKNEYGVLITNPPYGDRISEIEEVKKLYRDFGEKMKTLDLWSIYVITSHEDFEKSFGRMADRKRKLFNGNIKTDYYQFYGPNPKVKKEE